VTARMPMTILTKVNMAAPTLLQMSFVVVVVAAVVVVKISVKLMENMSYAVAIFVAAWN
jgi:hypothetical protein